MEKREVMNKIGTAAENAKKVANGTMLVLGAIGAAMDYYESKKQYGQLEQPERRR